jgi:hypothetical protein
MSRNLRTVAAPGGLGSDHSKDAQPDPARPGAFSDMFFLLKTIPPVLAFQGAH